MYKKEIKFTAIKRVMYTPVYTIFVKIYRILSIPSTSDFSHSLLRGPQRIHCACHAKPSCIRIPKEPVYLNPCRIFPHKDYIYSDHTEVGAQRRHFYTHISISAHCACFRRQNRLILCSVPQHKRVPLDQSRDKAGIVGKCL